MECVIREEELLPPTNQPALTAAETGNGATVSKEQSGSNTARMFFLVSGG